MRSNEELVESYKQGDKEAIELLIENNQGLINKMINKYSFIYRDFRMVDREDLIQEAYLGIIESAKAFKVEEGVKFMTYAPYHINKNLYRILGRSAKERNNIELNRKAKSLDAPVVDKDGNETSIIDLVEDNSSIVDFDLVEERIYLKALKNDLKCAFEENIVGRGKDIICYRYKLREQTNGDVRSYKEASEIFKLSVTRIKQLENNALVKIRRTQWYRKSKDNYNIILNGKIENYKDIYDLKSYISTYDVIDKIYEEGNKKSDFKNHIINKYLKGF